VQHFSAFAEKNLLGRWGVDFGLFALFFEGGWGKVVGMSMVFCGEVVVFLW
jgi:hypothetical protein